jgi:hypothetical protein
MQDIQDTVETTMKAMIAEANMQNITGVCVIAIARRKGDSANFTVVSESQVVERLVREPDIRGRGPGDMGTNYYSVAQMKVGEMLDTLTNSGCSEKAVLKYGEPGFKGGVIREVNGVYYMTAFSGASEEQDLIVAEAGMIFLVKAA